MGNVSIFQFQIMKMKVDKVPTDELSLSNFAAANKDDFVEDTKYVLYSNPSECRGKLAALVKSPVTNTISILFIQLLCDLVT